METVEIVIPESEREAAVQGGLDGFGHAFSVFLPLFLFCLVLRYYRSMGRANGSL